MMNYLQGEEYFDNRNDRDDRYVALKETHSDVIRGTEQIDNKVQWYVRYGARYHEPLMADNGTLSQETELAGIRTPLDVTISSDIPYCLKCGSQHLETVDCQPMEG